MALGLSRQPLIGPKATSQISLATSPVVPRRASAAQAVPVRGWSMHAQSVLDEEHKPSKCTLALLGREQGEVGCG